MAFSSRLITSSVEEFDQPVKITLVNLTVRIDIKTRIIARLAEHRAHLRCRLTNVEHIEAAIGVKVRQRTQNRERDGGG